MEGMHGKDGKAAAGIFGGWCRRAQAKERNNAAQGLSGRGAGCLQPRRDCPHGRYGSHCRGFVSQHDACGQLATHRNHRSCRQAPQASLGGACRIPEGPQPRLYAASLGNHVGKVDASLQGGCESGAQGGHRLHTGHEKGPPGLRSEARALARPCHRPRRRSGARGPCGGVDHHARHPAPYALRAQGRAGPGDPRGRRRERGARRGGQALGVP